MRLRRITGLVFTVALLAAGLFAVLQSQNIYDWYRLRAYTPLPAIAQLADQTSMTDYSRRLFYVMHPELNDREAFQQNCTVGEATIVLGCYVSNQGIYIYDVNDPRLAGIEEVTAAHEMLHVAYERLSESERSRIDQLTLDTFAKNTDERLAETIASYEKQDPSVVPNELHSILGTEVRQLPVELEAYYAQYFTDRTQVVSLAERYEKAFSDREDKIEAYDRQLADLEASINRQRQRIDSQGAALERQRAQLDQYLASDAVAAYNAGVASYNNAVREYNALLDDAQNNIDTYNRIVELRNDLAFEERELFEAIDSRSVPQAQ